jgi:hypothetical protein
MDYKGAIKKIIEDNEFSNSIIEDVEGLNVYESRIEVEGDVREVFYRFMIRTREMEDNQALFELADSIRRHFPRESEEMRYWLLLQEILEREIVLLGDQAVEIVNQFKGLKLDDIYITGIEDEKDIVVEDLLKRFKDVQGKVAPFLIAQHIGNISLKDINVPEELREKISE